MDLWQTVSIRRYRKKEKTDELMIAGAGVEPMTVVLVGKPSETNSLPHDKV